MRRTWNRLTALGSAALAGMSLLVVPTASAAPALDWRPCEGGPPWVECAVLAVPLDYRAPSGERIQLALNRIRSDNAKARRGVLLLNPGGPGAAGTGMTESIRELAPLGVLDAYDLIGFDPRGTGDSSPISCELTPEQLDATKVSPYPAPDGDISANVAYAQQVARQCGQHAGARLPHITTLNTARDMDRIRIALGERKISYFGVSYGSYLGAVYTSLFPERSDRIVLDSVVDPQQIWRGTWQAWGPATEERFEEFARWAARRHPTHKLGATAAAVRATVLEMARRLDAHPAGVEDGNLFREMIRSALYDDRSFPELANNLARRQRLGTGGQSAAAEVPYHQSNLATRWAVQCGDAPWPGSVAEHQRQVLAGRKAHPLTHGMAANISPCAFWPHRPVEPVAKISDRGPANVLLTQNRRDPATPLAGARSMRAALGERARLVVADQGGHGAYFYTGNACLTNAATAFLVDGELPARDLNCGAERLRENDTPARERAVRELRSRQFS